MEVIKGSDLKLLLKRKGITQELLSKELNVNRAQISRYFTDDVVPTYPFILKVAAFAGLSIDDLVTYKEAEVMEFNEPSETYKPREEHDNDVSLDNLGDIIREMQKKIKELQKEVRYLKKKQMHEVK